MGWLSRLFFSDGPVLMPGGYAPRDDGLDGAPPKPPRAVSAIVAPDAKCRHHG